MVYYLYPKLVYFLIKGGIFMENKSNGLCVAGFVVSLVTLFVFGCYGLSGIVGIVLSAIGRRQAINEGSKTALGTAGIVLGIINTISCWITVFSYFS